MTSVPSVIRDLVERFERNRDSYVSSSYNETQLRREFLDPFFTALGWDVDNQAGLPERYKEVIHEDSIRLTESEPHKAPDYCFRIGGTRKFFVEAKRPWTDLLNDCAAAFQVRRYAFSAKLPLSILTNFKDFVVYDCRFKPVKDDPPKTGRILYVNCTKYLDEWEKITGVFSRDAIWKGAFDKYAESTTGKKGTAEVDDEILKEIESWREKLAHNIALRNPDLTVDELNTAVSRTIDRILFLRVCEDRGTESDDQLKNLLKSRGMYARLFDLFHRADQRYNSGLFHFSREAGRDEAPDTLTPKLKVDDTPLKGIIRSLYYPDCPYVWSQIPADILGQVYEQFLGKVIRLTKGHQAKVEDKPEVKKAGGVYYTPTYIVDYIVKHTVGKLLEGKTPKEAAKLRILDPACGSGSFLIGAYQHLLDWYLEQYLKSFPPASAGGQKGGSGLSQADKKRVAELPIYQVARNEWRLSLAERKRILLDHIYGVDIDGQAVEVTKLSLLLKVLEGETQDTLESELKLRIRALPDLAANIKCGNSLIATDFYEFVEARGFSKNKVEARGFSKNIVEARGFSPLSEEDSRRINPFDWQDEFKEVFSERSRTFWLVTFVTHNARVSDRMVEFGVQKGLPLIFTAEERERVADILSALWREYGIPVIAGNVLGDHVHLVMAAENETELDEHVRKLKGASSYRFSRQVRQSEGGHVWQQKFNRKPLTTERALHDAQEYVWNNHLKHDSAPPDKGLKPPCLPSKSGKGLQPLVNAEEADKGLQPLGADKGLKPLASPLSPLVSPSPPYLERLRAACTSVEDAATIRGGFDAVIGNPPYGAEFPAITADYFKGHYSAHVWRGESYLLFVERAITLLRQSGLFGFIVPDTYLNLGFTQSLRTFLLRNTRLQEVVVLPRNVFVGATVDTTLLITERAACVDTCHPVNVRVSLFPKSANVTTLAGPDREFIALSEDWLAQSAFNVQSDSREGKIISRIEQDAIRVSDMAEMFSGIKVYEVGKGDPPQTKTVRDTKPFTSTRRADKSFHPFYDGKHVGRYESLWDRNNWIKYGPWLAAPRNPEHFADEKILIRKIVGRTLIAAYVPETSYCNTLLFVLKLKPNAKICYPYVLGILNSTFIGWYFRKRFQISAEDTFPQIMIRDILEFPVPLADKARHDKMVSLVEKMLELNKDLQKARTDTEQTRLKRQIAATDKQIDQLVYELYGLTEEEIRIVEDAEKA